MDINIYVKEERCLPYYATEGSSGFDLKANLCVNYIVIEPGEMILVSTGVYIEIPHGYEIQIRPRSSIAIKRGLTVVNSPGTVDSDYRGELLVGLINIKSEDSRIYRFERIAQAVVCPVIKANLHCVDNLEELSMTVRNTGGLGSTGS